MDNMYDKIVELCRLKNISPGKMCSDLGIGRGIVSELKSGRTKELSAKNIAKISEYFGVPADFFFDEQKVKPVPIEDELNAEIFRHLNLLTEQELKYLLAQIKGLSSGREP